MWYALIAFAVIIIAALAYYAHTLINQLKEQERKQKNVRDTRIKNIMQSVHVIALAMEQQQCDLSEGVIRLTNLLDALPLKPQPDFATEYPAIYGLHERIAKYPTHEARAALTKKERRAQDKEREQIESEYAVLINQDVIKLKDFNPLTH